MSADRPDQDRFDQLLGRALQKHVEPVPPNFTERTLKRMRQAEEQRILARIVLQQRLALAACIALCGIVAVVAAVLPGTAATVFRSIATGMTEQGGTLVDGIPHTIRTFGRDWQLYTILGAASVFAAYSLVELLVGHRLRIA